MDKFIFYEGNGATIQDYFYYADNLEEIDGWLSVHRSFRSGMDLYFFDEPVKILFAMRWS